MATGVVLDKHGKPSHDSPAYLGIIVLRQMFSKIHEEVLASHLSTIVRHLGLLHLNQFGPLSSLSSFDACSTSGKTVRPLQLLALRVSSLHHDINCGVDHVNAYIIYSSLPSKWVNHFLDS